MIKQILALEKHIIDVLQWHYRDMYRFENALRPLAWRAMPATPRDEQCRPIAFDTYVRWQFDDPLPPSYIYVRKAWRHPTPAGYAVNDNRYRTRLVWVYLTNISSCATQPWTTLCIILLLYPYNTFINFWHRDSWRGGSDIVCFFESRKLKLSHRIKSN